jgi:hypothetical protein
VEAGISLNLSPFNYDEPPVGHATAICASPPAGYAVIEDATMLEAATWLTDWRPSRVMDCYIGKPATVNKTQTPNMRLAGMVIKNVSATSSVPASVDGAGVIYDDPMVGIWARDVSLAGFAQDVLRWAGNATLGHPVPGAAPQPHLTLLTPSAAPTATTDEFEVSFANAGAAAGTVRLLALDDGLQLVGGETSWQLGKMSSIMTVNVKAAKAAHTGASVGVVESRAWQGATRCGVLSDGVSGNRTFCVM